MLKRHPRFLNRLLLTFSFSLRPTIRLLPITAMYWSDSALGHTCFCSTSGTLFQTFHKRDKSAHTIWTSRSRTTWGAIGCQGQSLVIRVLSMEDNLVKTQLFAHNKIKIWWLVGPPETNLSEVKERRYTNSASYL